MLNKPEFRGQAVNGRQPVRMLLVEDDPLFAELLQAQLRRLPWADAQLEVVGTLADALSRLAAESFGLVITDLGLPDSSGLATIEALSRAGEQPIIVLTGNQAPELRAGAIECGAYDFLSKDDLSAAVLERLTRLASLQASTYRSLRESEARFRSLVELSSDWYWEQDEELRFTRFDGRAADASNSRAADAIGRHRWALDGVKPLSGTWEEHRALLAARQPFRDFEYSRSGSDGQLRYLSASGEPVNDQNGRFRGYRGIATDITLRKRAEDDLRRFRLAMDNSPDIILIIDRASMRHVDANATACTLLGYSREELLALGPQDILPLSREKLEKTYDGMIAESAAVTGIRSYYRCKDGSRLPFESTRRVLRSGDSWLIAVISRDIRERIATEAALHQSEVRKGAILDAAIDAVITMDHRGRVLEFNAAAEAQFGYPRDEVAGKDMAELIIPPELREQHRNGLARYLATGKGSVIGRRIEVQAMRADGSLFDAELAIQRVPGAEPALFTGSLRDITLRKYEERLLKLEHAVTHALAEAETAAEGLKAVLRAICEAQDWKAGRVYRLDAAAGVMRFDLAVTERGSDEELLIGRSRNLSFARGVGLVGEAWRSGQSIWVADTTIDPRVSDPGLAREVRLRSALLFPVTFEDTITGVISISSDRIREPDERLRRTMELIGSQAGQFLQRKQVESARRESEARFRSLTELSTDLYWEQDDQYRFISLSGTRPQWLGPGQERLLGKRRWDQNYFNMGEADWAAHRAVLEAHQAFRDFELGRINAEGERVWVTVSGEPIFDDAGTFKGYRGVGKDITAHKREERLIKLESQITRCLAEALAPSSALREVIRAICLSEDWESGRYFHLDEAAGLMRFRESWSTDGSALAGFKEASRGLHFERGQGLVGRVWASGEPVWVVDVAKDARVVNPALAAAGLKGAYVFPVTFEASVIGALAIFAARAREPDQRLLHTMRVAGSQVGQFLMRKEAEDERLRREEDLLRFRAAMDMSLDAIYLTDRGTMRFVDVNEAACRDVGYAREQLLAMGPQDLLSAPREELAHEFDQIIALGGAGTRSEISYAGKDGRTGWTELHRRALRSGESWIIVTISRDITHRKLAEQRQAAHLRHQERIARFGQLALAKRDANDLIAEAVQEVLEALAAEGAAYVEAGPGERQLLVRAVAGLPDASADQGAISCAADDPVLGVLRSASRRLTEGSRLPFAWAQRLGSAALIPVRGESGARGVLCAFCERPGAFAAEEQNFLDAAASVLSTGLQRIDSEGRLAFLAQFDPLTGLPNRALLADRFSQMIVQARRRGTALSVLFIDLDEFKMVNDTLGHAGGDELLKEVAVRLQSVVRTGDTVARISGDEFAVVLADLARTEDAALVAQKIIERLSAAVDVHGHEVFVTASIGIAAFPGDGADAESLIGAADAAMYRAKQSGRNAFQFFTAEINQRSRARAQMGSELRRALEREEFTLAYQPKVDLADRKLRGAEALLRWQHPERGPVSPVEFIPVLEETGMIVAVGEWVLRRACQDLKAWSAAGLACGPVAVNLSARQFRLQDLDTRLKRIVAQTGVDPALIELEITESQLMQDPDHAIRTMRSLCDAGMRIAIDDFGTGYSSLSYLTRFPVGSLKIDRSFVAKIATEASAATIVRTIIEMAHTLGFTVVAEGVETEAQADYLRRHRCEQAQGYLFARPMPAAALLDFARRTA